MGPGTSESSDTVVLVHGLYMNGWDMALLRARLKHAGFATWQFSYPSLHASPVENARALAAFVAGIDAGVVHFIAHSLGGLVLHHLFRQAPDERPGRAVTLGAPHCGSHAAMHIADSRWATKLLGHSADQGLLGDLPPWPAVRELGVIAGSRSLGLGKFLGPLETPNDGTVAVSETEVSGAADRIVLHVAHIEMLFSSEVAHQTVCFLRNGRFARLADDAGSRGSGKTQ
ncbi:MAG: esterase/lipase family protein [Gammaproteobacteria bacterium]